MRYVYETVTNDEMKLEIIYVWATPWYICLA